jgi:hypothetical protein
MPRSARGVVALAGKPRPKLGRGELLHRRYRDGTLVDTLSGGMLSQMQAEPSQLPVEEQEGIPFASMFDGAIDGAVERLSARAKPTDVRSQARNQQAAGRESNPAARAAQELTAEDRQAQAAAAVAEMDEAERLAFREALIDREVEEGPILEDAEDEWDASFVTNAADGTIANVAEPLAEEMTNEEWSGVWGPYQSDEGAEEAESE